MLVFFVLFFITSALFACWGIIVNYQKYYHKFNLIKIYMFYSLYHMHFFFIRVFRMLKRVKIKITQMSSLNFSYLTWGVKKKFSVNIMFSSYLRWLLPWEKKLYCQEASSGTGWLGTQLTEPGYHFALLQLCTVKRRWQKGNTATFVCGGWW